MVKYYPWSPGDSNKAKERFAEILYELVRNPLAHSLGVPQTPPQRMSVILIKKTALREQQLRLIERPAARPKDVPQAVTSANSRHTVSLIGLYWGFIQMYRKLCQDTQQMEAAERRLAS